MKTTSPFRITVILDKETPVAQVESIERILDDSGEVLGTKLLPAEPLAMPLSAEILGDLGAQAIARAMELEKQLDAKDKGHEEALSKLRETLAAEHAAALAKAVADAVREKDEQIARLTAPGVTKLTIMRRLGDKWPDLKAILAQMPEAVQDAWTLAQEIRADDPLFVEHADALKAALGLTHAEFTALLTP